MLKEEKKCKNPDCETVIPFFENPKKLFCDSRCKSRYHYLKDLDENAEFNFHNKALQTNYKFIVKFIAKAIFVMDAEVARALDFKRRVFMDLYKRFPGEKDSRSLRRIKDVFFAYDMENDCIYFYDEKMVKDL